MPLPTADELWWARVMRALGAEPRGHERESCRLLREIIDLADELDRRGELAHVPRTILGREFRSASLDHPVILPLLDELGVCLDIGPCPRSLGVDDAGTTA